MENLDLAKNIMKARILTQNACENFHKSDNKKDALPVNVRILFMIADYGRVSPTLLIEKLYIAKSNLALMCKQLASDGLIEISHDLRDKRIIYYSLTESGKQFLDSKLKGIEYNITRACTKEDICLLNQKLTEINDILSKKF